VLQSATRTLSALDALSLYPNGATAKALSAELGLHLSTTYHLLNTLVAAGYVVQDPLDRHFRFGPRIPYLYQAFMTSLQPAAGVPTLLRLLHENTGETVHLGRLHGQDVVAIAGIVGTRPDAVPVGYVGMAAPAYATAIGQAILAALPPSLLEQYIAEADLSGAGLFPATDAACLRRELAHIRVRGYALDRGNRATGLMGCLASTVVRGTHQIPDALSVMVPRSRFLREEESLRAAVTAIAHAANVLAQTASPERIVADQATATQAALAAAMATIRPSPLADKQR
jgi:DNA-binding IclR family transcriptional regulator